MSRPIAVVNCRLLMRDREVASGVVLIENDVITAAGPDQSVTLPPDILLLDAEKGQISAGDMESECDATLRVGQNADLICRSRFGEVAWAMKEGVIIHPPGAPPPPAPISWQRRRQIAIDAVVEYLARRPENIYIQHTAAIPGFQKKGIDILWRFQAKKGADSLSIRVIPSLDDQPDTIFILDGKSARKLPEAGLSGTRAHWWFYHHGPDNVIYCFPTTALKKWMDHHAKEIPPTAMRTAGVAFQLSGRSIPIGRLQREISKTRVIQL